MKQPNPTGTHIKVFLGSILLTMLCIVSTWTIVPLGISDAFSQQTPVVDSTREKKAWTISWSEGPVSLTEVWVETSKSDPAFGDIPRKVTWFGVEFDRRPPPLHRTAT